MPKVKHCAKVERCCGCCVVLQLRCCDVEVFSSADGCNILGILYSAAAVCVVVLSAQRRLPSSYSVIPSDRRNAARALSVWQDLKRYRSVALMVHVFAQCQFSFGVSES